MENALHRVQQANEEQKAKYESQLQELTEKLREAEERSQRALSMAQQTKRGHVYIISNIGSFGADVYKIGLTRRLEPLDRVRELGDSSVPFEASAPRGAPRAAFDQLFSALSLVDMCHPDTRVRNCPGRAHFLMPRAVDTVHGTD